MHDGRVRPFREAPTTKRPFVSTGRIVTTRAESPHFESVGCLDERTNDDKANEYATGGEREVSGNA